MTPTPIKTPDKSIKGFKYTCSKCGKDCLINEQNSPSLNCNCLLSGEPSRAISQTPKASLHERRIEVNDINENGIHFMVHNDEEDYYGGAAACYVTLDAQDARALAKELLEAAYTLEEILLGNDPRKGRKL